MFLFTFKLENQLAMTYSSYLRLRGFLILIICFLIPCFSFGQEPLKAIRTNISPTIDGVLNEFCWKEIEPLSEYKSFIPDFGQIIPQRTESWITYDNENLYFAFKCYDEEPEKIKAIMSARDNIRNDDWICVNLDTYNDQQAITAIYVNPLGIQMDTKFAAGKEDPSIDLVWYSAGKLDEEGYSIEIRIPLKSIRFPSKDPVTMGMFLERHVSRTSTHVSYPELDPALGYAFLSQTLQVQYEGVKHYTLLEVLPAFTYWYRDVRKEDGLAKDLRKPDASLTVKYGISSNLILDATLNPDFSQIESDAGQVDVNLRFANFYSEKRPFFIEGQEKFNVAATRMSDIDPLVMLVHTRTMANPITGMKLNGKIGKNNDLSLIYALDELERTNEADPGFAHFPIIRYKRSLNNESYLGFLYTGREARLGGNRVYGADGQLRLNRNTLFEFSGFNTHTTDSTNSRSGHSLGVSLTRSNRDLDYRITARDIGKDYNVYTGYVRRTGLTQFSGLLSPKIYPASRFLRKVDFELFVSATHDRFYPMWETFNHVSAFATIGGTTMFKAKYIVSNEVFLGERFNTGGFHVLLMTRFKTWLSTTILYRRTNSIYYSDNPFQGKLNRLSYELDLQPFPKLNATMSFVYYAFQKSTAKEWVYRYPITRLNLSYQFNKYLFIRAITEYNAFYQKLLTDLLVSFTYIPGTVFYLGYGSLFQQEEDTMPFLSRDHMPLEMQRGLFLKISYLYRR